MKSIYEFKRSRKQQRIELQRKPKKKKRTHEKEMCCNNKIDWKCVIAHASEISA